MKTITALIVAVLLTACVRQEQPQKPFMIVKKDMFNNATCRYTYISADGRVIDFCDFTDKYDVGDVIE